jgi:general secretion pathway protein D
MKTTPLLAFLAISAAAMAQQPGHSRITIIFTDTDAAYVLQAISKQTGESILYNNKAKVSITMNLTVNTVDEAIRAVSSAASLVYRKVGSVYLVAPRDSMRDALAPYAHSATFTLEPGYADQVTTKVQDAFPFATVRAIGDKISFTGVAEDVDEASAMIKEIVRAQQAQKSAVADFVVMHSMNAEEAVPLIKGLYPGLDVTSTLGSKSAAPIAAAGPGETAPTRQLQQSYGAIGLRGPEALVKSARATIEKLDSPAPTQGPNKIVIKVYNLKYANGPSMTNFLRRATPNLEIYTGPEEFSPQRALFDPLTQQISNTQSGMGGSTSSGSSGGGSSSSGGGGGGGGSSSSGSQGGAAGAGSGPGSGKAIGDRAKSIVLKGRQTDVDEAIKLLAEIDVKPRQVMIEVKVIETSPTNAEQLGIGYTFSPVNFYEVPPGTLLTSAVGAVGLSNGNTQSVGPSSFSRTPFNFTATINAMVSHQTAKLLATPSLQVIDNDQGSIFIGNTISVELSSVSSLGGTSQSIASFPVGIILLISPRISPDGNVTMHVNPVVSTISSINSDGIPQTAAREAETTMIIKDGETMVLGGLIQDQDTKTVTAVPFLSSLPIVGELFKTRNNTRTREDILVSITPHILKEEPEGKK